MSSQNGESHFPRVFVGEKARKEPVEKERARGKKYVKKSEKNTISKVREEEK